MHTDRLDELAMALADPGWDEMPADLHTPASPAARQAAGETAVALGWCRLIGATPAEDGELPAPAALAATYWLADQVRAWRRSLVTLGDRWDWAPAAECDDLICDEADQILDAWAGRIAVREALDDSDDPRVVRALARLDEAVYALHEAAADQADLFAILRDEPYTETLRALILEEYRELGPAWIGGGAPSRSIC